jgi:anti-anti-sigma factor
VLSKKAAINGSYSDGRTATINWLPINSGHGLRINICGTLDQNLRREWRQLLEETAASNVGQFEFNLTETPNLTLTGLGMLLMFREQRGSGRGDIKLCHCNRDVWQLLQWTGMDKYFTVQGIPGSDDR